MKINNSIVYLSICGMASVCAAYMSYSFQQERNEELVRNAKYKAIPNGLSLQMNRPSTVEQVAAPAPHVQVSDSSSIGTSDGASKGTVAGASKAAPLSDEGDDESDGVDKD